MEEPEFSVENLKEGLGGSEKVKNRLPASKKFSQMIDYVTIKDTLDLLENEYNASLSGANPLYPKLYSKVAVMEFCGWIEESFDELFNEYIDRKIYTRSVVDSAKNVIKKTYGFEYKTDFLKLFSITVGANNVDNIISTINESIFQNILNTYKTLRNNLAHNYTVGTTPFLLFSVSCFS